MLLLAAALAGIGLLQACSAVGPDYVPPEIETPDSWHETLAEGLETGEADLRTWWESLSDPLLDDLIERASSGNLDLKEALFRIAEARARRGVAAGEQYPDLDATGSFERTRFSDNAVQDGFDVGPDNLYSAGFDASWEIDVFGRIRRSVESADAAWQASIEDYRDVLVTLFAEVALNYVEVRAQQQRLKYARSNVESQKKTLELAQIRFENGLVPKLDVTQAISNLANTESTVPSIEADLTKAVNRLCVLLGEHTVELREELLGEADIPAPPEQILVGLPAELLRQRPDVRRAERDLAAQTALIGVATADLYPRFSLSGYFAWQSDSSGDLLDASSQTYGFALPSIRWNIFDGSRIRNSIRVEEARTQQLLSRYENTVLLALEEVENFLTALLREKERLEMLARAVEASEESVELVQELYIDGLTDFQNVLDTERTLFNQQDLFVTSRGQVTKNLISLYKSLGGGWKLPEAEPDAGRKTEGD